MTNPIINEYGDQFFYDDQQRYHRDDGPAVIIKCQENPAACGGDELAN
jgi:hypothetical protein